MSSCESELLLEACIHDYAALCDWEDKIRKLTEHYDVVDSSSFKMLKNDLLKLINARKVEVHIRKIYWLPVSHFCLLRDCGTVQVYRQMDNATCGSLIDFNPGSERVDDEEETCTDDDTEPCKKKQKNNL
jgi:hypothetical protein